MHEPTAIEIIAETLSRCTELYGSTHERLHEEATKITNALWEAGYTIVRRAPSASGTATRT